MVLDPFSVFVASPSRSDAVRACDRIHSPHGTRQSVFPVHQCALKREIGCALECAGLFGVQVEQEGS